MKYLFSTLLLWASVAHGAAQCYQLVWADEFTGSSLDASKWTIVTGPGGAVAGNGELQYYTSSSSNINVSNGSLKITALNDGFGGNAYTSGRMQTKNLGDWLYGKFEARMKLPVGQGMWPAFWMLPTDNIYGVWPRSGEIDIMELIGKEPSNAYATIHTHSNGVERGFGSFYHLPTGTFADAFHVFSMEWSPNLIRYSIDGNLFLTQTNATVGTLPWVFDKRFYLLLNLAIGGVWAGAPDATTTFPQTMEVDYVRVYQNLDRIAIVGKTLVEPNTPSVMYTVPTLPSTAYAWSVTGAGNAIASGQGTAAAVVNWGGNSGTVSVAMSDGCAASATATTAVTVSPNLWDNAGFEQNYVAWDIRPDYNVQAYFNVSTTDFTEGVKSACVQTNVAGPNPWAIQLSRGNLSLLANTSYTLRFKAKADATRIVPASFIRTSNFSTVAAKSLNLTTDWQPFTLTFTPSANENVMFNLDLAGQLGTNCFDDFVFGRSAIMPVELLEFKGTPEVGGNLLTWRTANEVNVLNFTVEKSTDGQLFRSLAPLVAANNPLAYTFTDSTATNGVTYYRLRINERDGTARFSRIIAVDRTNTVLAENTEGSQMHVFPNPATAMLTVENVKGQTIAIIDVLGKTVLAQPIDEKATLNIQSLPNGVYWLKSNGQVARFVKN
jgi:beta-glucanase (GH16 family)